MQPFAVAAAHAAPVWLDPARTVDKAADMIAEAARAGARLVAFPESFLPGFPLWAALHAPIRTHDAFAAFAAASVLADGPEIARVRQAAARAGVFVSFGFSERNPASAAALWNSNLLIGDDGAVLVHHRKLVPTFLEKLAWNPVDGEGLRVGGDAAGPDRRADLRREHQPARPLRLDRAGRATARRVLPACLADAPAGGGNYDNHAATRIRAAAHAFEGKCFVAVVAGCLDARARDWLAAGDPAAAAVVEATPAAESFFVDPTGVVFGDARTEGCLA